MHLSTSKAMVFKMQQCAGGGAAEGAEPTPKCLGLKPDHSKVPAQARLCTPVSLSSLCDDIIQTTNDVIPKRRHEHMLMCVCHTVLGTFVHGQSYDPLCTVHM